MNRLSALLILLGLLILALDGFYLLATVVIDTAPPIRVASTPMDGSTYASLSEVSIRLRDETTEVAWVHYNDTSGIDVDLILKSGDPSDGLWAVAISTPPPGVYSFQYAYRDLAGNTAVYKGSYRIYTQLKGVWYINGMEVTPDSKIISDTRTIRFKFVKTSGIDDRYITCTASIEGLATVTLDYVGSSTWEASYTFPRDGLYTVELKASDGIGEPVTLTLVQIGSPKPMGGYLPYIALAASTTLITLGFLWRKR